MSGEVIVSGLGVRFDLDRQSRPLLPTMRRVRRRVRTTWPLREVSFAVPPGESVALVGRNGAGKTTLLRTLAGVLPADEGTVSVRGRVGSLLSIDSGLTPALTGRENTVLLGVLTGLSRRRAMDVVPAVWESSGLGDAFDRPVSTYSQGMRARLGFSVIELTEPEVLLLDEVHEALDEEFRARLQARAHAVCAAGGVVVAAGHNLPEMSRLCRGVLELDSDGVVHREWRAEEAEVVPAEL